MRVRMLALSVTVLLFASVCAFTQGLMGNEALFQPVSSAQGNSSLAGKYGVARFRFVTVETSRVGTIAPDGRLIPASTVLLNLFDDMVVLAALDRLEGNAVEGWIWVGHVTSPSTGTVILAFNGTTVSCTAVVEGRRFQIRNDGGLIPILLT